MTINDDWFDVNQYPPPQGVEIMTKIHDSRGERNVTTLKLKGLLWFFPDMSMYVYYAPTHWRKVSDDNP